MKEPGIILEGVSGVLLVDDGRDGTGEDEREDCGDCCSVVVEVGEGVEVLDGWMVTDFQVSSQ